ncbi:MAG: superoxide dismutase family protein [Oscillospiraceae bacterium]|nr:superoxide dismutase family protein [Oscillospiraceae bacterium]
MRNQICGPDAVACVRGGAENPCLRGTVRFFQLREGTLVEAEVSGLPESETGFFAFHIHEGDGCGGEGFSQSGGHYDPGKTAHPMHAGDLPPLLACGGRAFAQVLTGRFRVCDIIGRTVIIHSGPDDFHTQPAGNPGAKIACGVIRRK